MQRFVAAIKSSVIPDNQRPRTAFDLACVDEETQHDDQPIVARGEQPIMTMNGMRAHRPSLCCLRSMGVVAVGVCLTQAAFAGLGDTAASVQRDHTALRGTSLTVTPMASYDLHEITSPDSRVREYVSHAGTVFAVTWSGRARPDLSVV